MADNYLDSLSSAAQMQANYEKYRDKYKDSTEEMVNSETFLNLMVKEMTNQDPLEPTSNTEFISQLAQFSQLTYAKDSSRYSMANYASSLVGKVATAYKKDGKNVVTKTGVVESVVRDTTDNSYTVTIEGEKFKLNQITGVSENKQQSGITGVTSTGLADSIARASGMIGMYATVPYKDGKVSGWIDTIKIKDGKITAVIADINGNPVGDGEYDLEKIVEVTYATVADAPTGTGNNAPAQNQQTSQTTAPSEQTSGSSQNNSNANIVPDGNIADGKKDEDVADLVDDV